MKRPKPTKQLIYEFCGGREFLLRYCHHGLADIPLTDFYPHLNFNEVIAFSIASWLRREQRPSSSFAHFVKSATPYEIFIEVYRDKLVVPQRRGGYKKYNNVFHLLNFCRNLPPRLEPLYRELNPFGQKKTLKERLERVSPLAIETLKEGLQKGITDYVFECEYDQRKRERDGDNYKLEVMNFQTVYPRKGRVAPNYAAEIARFISSYPQSYEPLEQKLGLSPEECRRELMEMAQEYFPDLEPEEALEKMYPED